jgi:hypothetical protein
MTPDTSINQSDAAFNSNARTPWIAVLVFVALPILFSSIALFPELQYSGPYQNDQVFHYLFIERANQAISAGDNPFDHWLPELELGFPQFIYYQNLPHLAVVGLYRLLLQQVSLIRLLNLVRYLLMVTFPLTVYWSMRRMEFSPIAAAIGAAFSPMLSCEFEYGFDFNSYVSRGLGMFPQLCSMHLMFIGAACIRHVLEYGRKYAAAIIASSAMVLSDLLYGYIFAILVALLWLVSVLKTPRQAEGLRGVFRRMERSTVRLALVAAPVAMITAYQTVPFLAQIQYLNLAQPPTPRHSPFKVVGPIMSLVAGFFDNGRLPVITVLVIVGIFYCVMKRREEMKIALTMMIAWPLLFLPNVVRTLLVTVLPLARLVPFQRCGSGIDFGAILTVGLGGECIWQWFRARPPRMRLFVPIVLLLLFYGPAMSERWNFYSASTELMESSAQALRDDDELPQIMSALKKAPPGRVYAGTRGNWGTWMRIGGAHFYDLLPVAQFATVMPWQTLSLNSPLLWRLSTPSLEICRLFNIRYVVAPAKLRLPDWYHPIVTTSDYVLCEVDSGGYAQLGRIARIMPMGSSQKLFNQNDEWVRSGEPAQGKFNAFLHPDETSVLDEVKLLSSNSTNDASLGTVEDEVITPDSLSARVTASSPAAVIFKTTYHPNWHVTVDGHEQRAFMVSPSFIGTAIEPGHHEVKAEYRSSLLKKTLLVLACFGLLATVAFWVFGGERWMFDSR